MHGGTLKGLLENVFILWMTLKNTCWTHVCPLKKTRYDLDKVVLWNIQRWAWSWSLRWRSWYDLDLESHFYSSNLNIYLKSHLFQWSRSSSSLTLKIPFMRHARLQPSISGLYSPRHVRREPSSRAGVLACRPVWLDFEKNVIHWTEQPIMVRIQTCKCC